MNDFIIKRFGEILFKFNVLYSGWECDETGYVVRDSSGIIALILSTHGSFYVANASEIEEKIAEYKEAISNSQKALSLLKQESI